jgi:D-3-phosphoglycerate dehydrogenase
MRKTLVTSRSFGITTREPIEILEAAGISYTLMGANFCGDTFREEVVKYDALIIGVHPFASEDMERCVNLKIIAKHGAGLDNIDTALAKKMGVTVTNVPSMNANAVADLTFAHILNVSRGVSVTNTWVREGKWKTYTGRDVYAKTLGLVGFGAIAKNVAKRARGFSMDVLAYDPYVSGLSEEWSGFVRLCSFDEVIAGSDIVSIHVPLTSETENMFNRETIKRMKREAVLVNTGRGGVVNENDLYLCMRDGHLFGAALDVTATEPIERDNPLLTLENVVITPHIGMYSLEALGAVSVVCAKNVVKALNGETPDFVID